MGSYAPFLIGLYEFTSTKHGTSGELLSLFREADRLVRHRKKPHPENIELLEYSTSASNLIDRLEVVGFTEEACRSEFEKGIASIVDELSDDCDNEYGRRRLQLLQGLSYARWLQAFEVIRRKRLMWTWDPMGYLDPLLNYMLDPNEDDFLGFPSDFRFALRAGLSTVFGRTKVH